MQQKKRCNVLHMKLKTALTVLCLLVLTACGQNTIYVRGTSEAITLKKGDIVPYDGWLLQNEAMLDLIECCENNTN